MEGGDLDKYRSQCLFLEYWTFTCSSVIVGWWVFFLFVLCCVGVRCEVEKSEIAAVWFTMSKLL